MYAIYASTMRITLSQILLKPIWCKTPPNVTKYSSSDWRVTNKILPKIDWEFHEKPSQRLFKKVLNSCNKYHCPWYIGAKRTLIVWTGCNKTNWSTNWEILAFKLANSAMAVSFTKLQALKLNHGIVTTDCLWNQRVHCMLMLCLWAELYESFANFVQNLYCVEKPSHL